MSPCTGARRSSGLLTIGISSRHKVLLQELVRKSSETLKQHRLLLILLVMHQNQRTKSSLEDITLLGYKMQRKQVASQLEISSLLLAFKPPEGAEGAAGAGKASMVCPVMNNMNQKANLPCKICHTVTQCLDFCQVTNCPQIRPNPLKCIWAEVGDTPRSGEVLDSGRELNGVI